jgi:hypothetical protein
MSDVDHIEVVMHVSSVMRHVTRRDKQPARVDATKVRA